MFKQLNSSERSAQTSTFHIPTKKQGFAKMLYNFFRGVSLCMKGLFTTCESMTNVSRFETGKSIAQITLITLVHRMKHI